jgi:hypothetical protein
VICPDVGFDVRLGIVFELDQHIGDAMGRTHLANGVDDPIEQFLAARFENGLFRFWCG